MGDLTGTTLLDKYKLTGVLGRGGMGAVYQGTHLRTGRKVAVKVLDDRFLTNRSIVQRFGREARAASSIEHPGIVEVLDLDQSPDGAPFLVMELLDGETLGAFVERKKRLTQAEALEIFEQLLEALEAAHERGIVHRDLKPDNIFLLPPSHSGKRVVKILDFGISQKADEVRSHLTQTGAVLGTPHYMSPEQALGETALDARADLYAAAIVLYECVVGEVPYDAGNYNALLQSILRATPPQPRAKGAQIDQAFEDALLAAMSKDKAKRPATAAEWSAMLTRAASAPTAREMIAAYAGKPGSGAPPARPRDDAASSAPATQWGEFATLGSKPAGRAATPTPPSSPPATLGAPSASPLSRRSPTPSGPASNAGKELDDFGFDSTGPALELDDSALASPGRGRLSHAPDSRRSHSGTLAAVHPSSGGGLQAAQSSPGVVSEPRTSSSGTMAAVSPRRPSGAAIPAVSLPPASADLPLLGSEGLPTPPRPTLVERFMALPRTVRMACAGVLALGAIIIVIRLTVRPGDDVPIAPPPNVVASNPLVVPIAPQTVLVDVSGLPQQARVKLDGLPVGALPLRVRRGEHHVLEIEAPGYDPRRIEIAPQENMHISAEMRVSF